MIKTDIASLVRTSLIVVAALGSAAGCAPEPVPVDVAPAPEPVFLDGLYVTGFINGITDTCVDEEGNTTASTRTVPYVSADLLQHPWDGLFSLDLPDTFVGLLTDFAIAEDGSVNIVREDSVGKTTVTGTVTPDRIRLQASDEYSIPGVMTCVTTAKVTGVRRPVALPDSPDGIYAAFAEIGPPNSCPVSDAVQATATRTMDIMQVSYDGAHDFNGPGFSFRTVIGADGVVDSETPITREVTHGTVATYTQKAVGTLNAPDGQLTVDLFMPNRDGVNCGQRSTLFLEKRIPDQYRPQNDYRVASTMTASAGCRVNPTNLHSTARIITDDFGLLTLHDDIFPRGTTIALGENGYFKSVIKTLASDGYDLWIEGAVLNGVIDYEYVSIDPATETAPECTLNVEYSGLMRYAPLAE